MEGLQHDLVISRIFSPTVSSTDERRDTAEREKAVLRAKCLIQLYGRHACPPGAATRLYGTGVTLGVWCCILAGDNNIRIGPFRAPKQVSVGFCG